ncbi:MAG: DUF2975 domain-containing protein [Oscillospiraceae bacterium]|nr:DUF2975 domain-containing protein [Oscillospiraceae bacterium]
MEKGKMMKTAAVLDRIAKILGAIAKVCGIICLVFAVLVLLLGEKMFAPGTNVLGIGFIEFQLAGDYQSITPAVRLFTVISLVIAAVNCFIFYFIAKHMRRVLSSAKEGRPFDKSVSQSFRTLGILSLAGGLLSELFKWAQQLLLLKAYPVEEIFASPAISGMKINFIMDMSFVVIALVFFLLSWVFGYGYELQKQSDETL